jgi:acyl dehydratase
MSDLEALVGREYGPFAVRVSSAKVDEYVAATGDDPGRWTDHAPPSYGGALLFVAAPAFFADEVAARYTRLLIHGEQQFTWHRPLPIGETLSIRGTVERIRERGGVHFATFVMDVVDGSGAPFLESRSMFLMSDEEPPGAAADDRPEPAPDERGPNDVPADVLRLTEGGAVPPLEKSASRSDLVRYAAASTDYNPIHWDHGLAVEAGLGGVVVHGLLMAAWASQAAGRLASGSHPLLDGRFRFKAPLAAAVPATVSAVAGESEAGRRPVDVVVSSGDTIHMTAALGIPA